MGEVEPVEAKNLMQISANFVKCLQINLLHFLSPQNCTALRVGCASNFIICSPTKLSSYFAFFASVNR